MPAPSLQPRSKVPVLPLAIVAGLDVAFQAAVLWLPSPFAGVGLVGVALLPVALAWYLLVLAAILVGVPLAYLCIRQGWLAVVGVVLLVLSALNLGQAWHWYAAQQPTKAERTARDLETRKADEVYRCMTQWFSVPRRVEAVQDSELVFAGGVRIDVCRRDNRLCGGDPASVARRDAFGRFAREHVQGAEVSVVLTTRPYFRYEGGDWCAGGAPPATGSSVFPGRYPADVSFHGRRLTVTDQPPRIEDFR